MDRVLTNTCRYTDLFSQVIDEKMPKPSVNFREQDATPFNILMEQRQTNIAMKQQQQIQAGLAKAASFAKNAESQIPKELTRAYQVFIIHGENAKK